MAAAAWGLSCAEEPGTAVKDVDIPSLTAEFSPPRMPEVLAVPATPGESRREDPLSQLNYLLDFYDLANQQSVLSELASDRYLGRKTGSAGAQQAARYISGQFQGLGLVPWSELGLSSYAQEFSLEGYAGENIIGILPGSGSGYIILAAHYDHLGTDATGQVFNGADDNAAGVAAMIEAARMIRHSGLPHGKTIVFCAFSGEEQGQLGARSLGSLIASSGLAGGVEMINIDGIGATGGSYFGVWDEGASFAAPLVSALKQAGDHLGVRVVEEGTDIGSDAQPFDWQFGIPAVTVDWHWGADESRFHPYYHTVYDDPGNISAEALSTATRTAISGLWLRASS